MAISFMNALFASGGGDLEQTPFWVLMTLCWHVNESDAKTGVGSCWPSTKTIAQKAHVSELTARKAIKTLIEKGLITAHQPAGGVRTFTIRLDRLKDLEGGKEVDPPKDVYPLKDVEGAKDVCPLPLNILRGTPASSLPPPPKDLYPETGKEHGIETGKKQEEAIASRPVDDPPPPSDDDIAAMSEGDLFNGAVEMVDLPKEKAPAKKPRAKKPSIARPDDVSEQTWNDFQTLRKTRRAPITQTVIDGFRKECAIAGIDLEEAMKICVRQGWQGFKADWCRRDNRSDYLPNSKFKRQECRKYKKGI